MCFNFLTGRTGPSMGPQSSADKAAGGYKPSVNTTNRTTSNQINTFNPHSDTATAQGKRAAIESKQTANRNTIRRADSYGSSAKTNKGVTSIMSSKSNWQDTFKSKYNKTILGA